MNESEKGETQESHAPQVDLWTASFLKSLAETSVDLILSLDNEGRVEYANGPALLGFGYSASEMAGLSIADLVPPGERQAIAAHLNRLKLAGGSGKIERSAIGFGLRKDGTSFPLDATISNWQVNGVSRLMVWARDLTGSRAIQGTLEMLGKAVSQSPAIVIITDPEGKIEYVNSKFTEVTGYTGAETLGKTPRLLKSGELPEAFYRRMWESIKGGSDWRGEFHNKRKDGGFYWASTTISPVKDFNGNVAHFVAIQEDVTDKKAQEARLVEVNETLGALVNASPLAILTLDSSGAVRLWNNQAERLFGWKAADVVGHFNPIVPPDQINEFLDAYRKLLETGTASLLEVPCLRKDGNQIDASLVAAAMHDPAGVTIGAVLVLTDVTEHKRLLEGLRESEEKFRHSFEDAPVGMTITEKNGRYYRVNRAFSKMLGYSIEDLQSIDFASVTHPEDLAANMVERARLEAGEVDSFSLEKRYIHRDGHIIWASLTVSALHDATGQRAYDLAVVEDISLRKAFEDALAESEVRYRTLFQHSPIPLWEEDYSLVKQELDSISEKGVKDIRAYLVSKPGEVRRLLGLVRVVDANNAALAFHHATKEEALAGITEIVDESGYPQEAGLFAALAAHKTKHEMEVFNRTLDGHLRQVELEVLVPPGFEESCAKVLIAIRDITALKQAEAELKASEERFRLTFDNAAVGMTLATPEGTIVGANPAFCRMLGYAEAELKKMSWRDFTHPDDIPTDELLSSELLRRKINHYHLEKRYLRKGGSPIWVRITVSLIRGGQGEPRLAITQAEDISEARELQAKLREYSLNLEKKVEERTRELDESHKKLIDAERLGTIGSVAAQVGHDLRNPLTTINTSLFYLASVLPLEENPKVKETVDYMDSAIKHANRIIEDLLMYSRPSPIKKVKVDLQEVVKAAFGMVAVPPGVKTEVSLQEGLKVAGDRSKLIRVFQNLISNAFDAMPAGGSLKVISSASRNWAKVTVSDTGVGMTRAQLQKAFVPLYTTKAQGLGMGLSICKRLVEAHGGRISAASKAGLGSTFKVELPLASASHPRRKSQLRGSG